LLRLNNLFLERSGRRWSAPAESGRRYWFRGPQRSPRVTFLPAIRVLKQPLEPARPAGMRAAGEL